MKLATVEYKFVLLVLILLVNRTVFGIEIKDIQLEVVTENLKPYNYIVDGEITGPSTDIVKLLLERANIKYDINVYPWARAYHIGKTKENVLIYTIVRTPRREALFKWVGQLGNGGTTSLYRLKKNNHINVTTLEEAKTYAVGTSKNTMDYIWLTGEGFENLHTAPMKEQNVKMFFKERTDLIAFDDSILVDEFTNLGFDTANIVKVMPLFKTPPYIALSLSTSDEILEKLQKAYNELLHENKIKFVN